MLWRSTMNEEMAARNYYLMQQYREQAEELYGQSELLDRLIGDYMRTMETVQELSGISQKDTLIPIGGNAFVHGKISDTKHVIVNVGRGKYIEKTTNAAVDTLNKKIEDLKKSQEKILKAAEETRLKMEDIVQKLNEQNVQIP